MNSFIVLIILLIVLFIVYKIRSSKSSSVKIKTVYPKNVVKEYFESYKLLREATKLKKSGDINGAIEALKMAYSIKEEEGEKFEIEDYLRLPNYLRMAGKNDKAWGFYNKMLLENRSPYSQWKIYDKMRLHLQREGKNEQAVIFGVFSHLMLELWIDKYKREEGEDALSDWMRQQTTKDDIIKLVGDLLKKAKRDKFTLQISDLVWDELNKIPKVDFHGLKNRINKLLTGE